MKKDTSIIFGKILKILREERNLSQEQLANKSTLDRTYISLLERGLRQPTLNTVFLLSNALNIKPTCLVEKVYNEVSQ